MINEEPKQRRDLEDAVARIGHIAAVPTILDVVCRTTGMRLAAVAHVTAERWIACSVLDQISFGLSPGHELRLDTTICHEIRQSRRPIVIDHVAEDARFRNHPSPATYGFQSYISVPILLGDGSFFGTLCAIDPLPARVNNPETIGMFRLFAELIGEHLDKAHQMSAAQAALMEERAVGDLREQFIAVLGHDLRTPVRAISAFTKLLIEDPSAPDAPRKAQFVRDATARMQYLVDNLTDLAHSRHLGAIPIRRELDAALEPVLREVIAEHRAAHPHRLMDVTLSLEVPVVCDRYRVAQLLANLLGNAVAYGSLDQPVRVHASSDDQGLELWVANAGDPIPEAMRPHLFEPFFRNNSSRNRQGLGLGLYIAHQVAEAHDGTLTVTSNAEETRFTFRMPRAEVAAEHVRHQCMIYEGSPAAHLPALAKLMARKLDANLRVFYLNAPPMVAGISSYLSALGIDVAAAVRQGSLVLSSTEAHFVKGRFHPENMLGLLDDALTQALARGYAGLWTTGDMTWQFGSEKNYTKLREYEHGLEALSQRRLELQGLCQYQMDSLPPSAPSEALYLHRACFINETLCRVNHYYAHEVIPPSHLATMLAGPSEHPGTAS